MAASGIKVIIAGSSVSDLALKYINRHSIAVLKVPSKFDLRRICSVVNATPLKCMGTPTPEEEGWVDVYESVEFDGGRMMTVLRQLVAGDPESEKLGKRGNGKGDKTPTATIVLRGPAENVLCDLESAIDNGMNLIRTLLRDRRLVPGAGATELELAKQVGVYGDKMKGHQRHAVKGFAMALEVIPRTLAENAAAEREGNEGVERRLGENEAAEPSGGDMEAKPPSNGMILADSNSLPYPILDSLEVKRCAIKHATNATIEVLNIDINFMSRGMEQGPHRAALTSVFDVSSFSTLDKIIIYMWMFAIGTLVVAYSKDQTVARMFSSFFRK